METFDEVLVQHSNEFMDKAKKDGKPFFIWHNPTRMHAYTFVSPKYQAIMNSESNFGLEEAGMAQLDDSVGSLVKHVQDIGEADNTIVIFTTDNGAEVFTWPDGGMTPFKATKGTISRVASGCRASFVGRVRLSRAQSRTEFSPASIGCQHWLLQPETQTSLNSF
jgi:arylsulfatase